MGKSYLESVMMTQIESAKLKDPITEFRFFPERRWRVDIAWPDEKILLEIEGAVWANGRHVRGSGFSKDCEKYNQASIMGYTIIRATSDHIKNGKALEWVIKAFRAK